MRRAARIDENQPGIVELLRAVGAKVEPTHAVGAGFPDLVVAYRGRVFLLEVKDGRKPPSDRRLTKDQQAWHGEWSASCGPHLHVVNNGNEALDAIGARLVADPY